MRENNLKKIMESATEQLRSRENARDEILGRARKTRMISKKAILLAHNGEYGEAEAAINKARKLMKEMKPYLIDHPEIEFYNEVKAAKEEYSESYIFYSLLRDESHPNPDKMDVEVSRYILGLGDVPGELRREALESLRKGKIEKAEKYLGQMEEIYLNLVSMEEASLLLKGLRRKLDITRGVIEKTRAEITAEAGRNRLKKSINELLDNLL